MIVKDPHGKITALNSADYWSVSLFSKEMDDEKMERLMYSWDYLLTRDGLYFRQVGIQSIDWEYEGDELKILWPKNEAGLQVPPKHINNDTIYWTRPVSGFQSFIFENPAYIPNNVIGIVNDYLLRHVNANDVFVREMDLDIMFFTAPNKDKYGNYVKEAKDKIIEIVSSSENVEKDWNDWLKSKEPDVRKVLDELNTMLAK